MFHFLLSAQIRGRKWMNGYLEGWVNFIYLFIYLKFNNAFLGAILLNIHDFSYDQNNCDYES